MSVRTSWLQAVVRECQVFIGDTSALRGDALVRSVSDLERRLPEPASPLETILKRALLTELCVREFAIDDLQHLRRALHASRVIPQIAASAATRPADVSRAKAVMRLADELYQDHITLDLVARRLHLHRNAVARSFKSTFGLSFHEYLVQLRVMKASELLKRTPYKIEVIAGMVGYRSKKNFYIEFRRLVGATPAVFREARTNRNHEVQNDTRIVTRPR